MGKGGGEMKLLTEELKKEFAKVGRQEGSPDPLVIAKFFYPMSGATWWATEYIPEDECFFGYISLFGDHNDEWGYFSLQEMQETKIKGIGIERDLYFDIQPMSKACPEALRRLGRDE